MQSNKRKRQELDASSDLPKPKRLTKRKLLADLNDDVLQEIFSYLDAKDLVSVVKSDKVLLDSSRRAFQQKYKAEFIQLPLGDGPYTTKQCFSRNAELLRYFGANISKLQVCFDKANPINQRIFHLIVTCCRETLSELEVVYPSGKWVVNKPFTRLKTLSFKHGDLDLPLSQLVKWCPVLENLGFDCVDGVGRILRKGPKITSLKYLWLDFSDEKYDGLSYHIEDLHSFMQRNPQLNELSVMLVDYNIDTFNRPLMPPSLHDKIMPDELLTVEMNIIPYEDHADYSFALEHLKIPNDRIANLVIIPLMTVQLTAYMAECVNLKTLKFVSWHISDFIKTDEIDPEWMWIDSTKLQQLTQVEVEVCMADTDDKEWYSLIGVNAIRPFVKQCTSLTTIKIYYSLETPVVDQMIFDDVRSKIDLKIWSFKQEFLPNEISFTLTKAIAA